ncbi:jg21666 [Pararge aegeria aegeria]|uniref:Jg21666 protein n=1 Tax=Pararge aegeria aegeria TaxID=348720 RepID=A0A8S4RL83_9NEOP|nr:jg21666 [Pararge aegeria aegeria]
MEYQPHKDDTAHGVSLFSGRTGKEEQDCEVPEHAHRSISGTKMIILLARRSTESKALSWYLAEPPHRTKKPPSHSFYAALGPRLRDLAARQRDVQPLPPSIDASHCTSVTRGVGNLNAHKFVPCCTFSIENHPELQTYKSVIQDKLEALISSSRDMAAISGLLLAFRALVVV